MSCQQNQQKFHLPAKYLPKCPPKWLPQALQDPQAPQASVPCPAPCPAPCPPPAPSCCVPSCCITGFGGCCSLGSHVFPGVCLGQPQPSNCWERESSGCSSCCHGFRGGS
ncbi:late cornified envelope protein 2A [Ursus americanus]|uniref:late cornified envelope protein 2A n=1 Tax=Ursus americanus TaxID=9643 RepID=UPI001E67D8D9|nr:late cornified envelope protein 2A [Ursus americanus]